MDRRQFLATLAAAAASTALPPGGPCPATAKTGNGCRATGRSGTDA
nr:twin-arginine translocation signal domain-containing protein [Stenotrophomonas maltophilia]